MIEPASYPCVCGAIVRITVDTVSVTSTGDPSREYTVQNELRVTRRLAHEGSGMLDTCRAHVLTLRDQIAEADREALSEYADQLEQSTAEA